MSLATRIRFDEAAHRSGVSPRTLERILTEEGVEVPRLGKGRLRLISPVLLDAVLERRSCREAQKDRIESKKSL